MLKNIKSLTKQSAVYGVGHILSRSVGFLLLPIHTRFLQPVDYGIVSLLFSSLAILNVVFTYGMDAAFLRFFVLGEAKVEKQRVFSTANWMIFCTGVLFSAILFFNPSFFSRLIFMESGYTRLVRMASGIVFADALSLLPFLVLRGEEKAVQFVLLKAVNILVTVGLNVLFVVVLKKGVEGVFMSNLIASVCTVLTVFPIFIRWFRLRFKRDILNELLRFGLPYIPAGLAMVIMDQISRFFLDRMLGREANAIFSASYKLGMFMSLVVAAFRFAWHPFFLSTSKKNNAPEIFARVLTYFTFVTGILFLLVSGWIHEIMAFRIFGLQIVGRNFENGAPIVPVVLISYIAYGFYIHFMVGIYLKKKTHYLPFVTGAGALVSIGANAILIPLLGIMGAAWATFLGYATMAIALYVSTRSLYPIPYEWMRIAKLILLFGLMFLLFSVVHSPWLKLGMLLASPAVLGIAGFLNEQEKGFLRRAIRAA